MCNTPQNMFSLLCNWEVQYCCISYLLTTPLGPDNLCLVDPSILKPSDPALDLCPNPSPLQPPPLGPRRDRWEEVGALPAPRRKLGLLEHVDSLTNICLFAAVMSKAAILSWVNSRPECKRVGQAAGVNQTSRFTSRASPVYLLPSRLIHILI